MTAISIFLKSASRFQDLRFKALVRCRASVRAWSKTLRRLSDPYKPEAFYMRGPGPRWREKHHAVTVSANSARKTS